MSDWIVGYLSGCVVALFVYSVEATLAFAIKWISKSNILQNNLKKLDPPDNQTFWVKMGIWALNLLAVALLSWIQVLVSLWSIFSRVLKVLREMLTAVPEEIKQLRFPLYNNPDMSRESVWAYLRAVEVKAGEGQPTDYKLLASLESVGENHPSFNRVAALNHLKNLNTVNAEIITSAIGHLGPQHDLRPVR